MRVYRLLLRQILCLIISLFSYMFVVQILCFFSSSFFNSNSRVRVRFFCLFFLLSVDRDHILQNKARVWQNIDLRTVFPSRFCYIYKVFRRIMEKYLLVHSVKLTVIILRWKKYTDILLAMHLLFGVHFVGAFFIKHFYSDYSDLLVWISLHGCAGML